MPSLDTERFSAENIVDWIDRSSVEFPLHPAAEESDGRSIRYRDFADLSRAVQAWLMAGGVRPGDRVGVFMKKSIDSLIAFQSILRCGAAYVPTDPLAPAGRAAFALNDCDVSAIFVDADLAEELRGELDKFGRCPLILVLPARPKDGHTWRIEAFSVNNFAERVTSRRGDLACLFYTSGSTGAPKAVMITHENVVSFVDWCSEVFAPTTHDKFATHSPLHFSLSVFNLYVAWKHGGTVVLIDEQTARIPQLLAPLIDKLGISIWFSTPTILSLLAQSGQLPSFKLERLRLLMFSGEQFPSANLRSLKEQLPHPRYVHVLGSTETHMIAHYDVPSEIPEGSVQPMPIGKVAKRFRSRIVDENGNDVALGMDGELCLAGSGITPGLWKASQQTQAAFVDAHGERWHRTGDIVRAQSDGNLVYRGRRDRMIKKRGYRIELAEIELCLYRNPTVKETAVVAVPDDEVGMKVQAFVVPRDGSHPTIIELKAHCAKILPPYMVPDAFAFQDSLPRTSTGKIDFPTLKGMVV